MSCEWQELFELGDGDTKLGMCAGCANVMVVTAADTGIDTRKNLAAPE